MHIIYSLTFFMIKKLLPLKEAMLIYSTLTAYAVNDIGTARHGLRNLHEIDSEWDIFNL